MPSSKMRYLPVALTVLLALHASPARAFTEEQAVDGTAAYVEHCAACHGPTLRQLPDALLAGREFLARWGDRSAGELFEQVQSTMPPTAPGELTEDTYLAIVAFLLQSNGGSPDGQPLGAATARLVQDGLSGSGAPAVALAGSPSAGPIGVTVPGTVDDFTPVTDAMLRDPAAADWLMIRRDYSATSYSPLDEVTAENAHQLQLVWTWPMREGGTNQPAPLVHDGTMYLANTGGIIQALDARDGTVLWETRLATSVQGYPISFAIDGKQYIAVATGLGGGSPRGVPAVVTPEIRPPNRGHALYVFALP